MFKNLNPRQRKILIALLGAGGLALVVMIARRGSGAAAAPASDQSAVATPTGAVPTFADNGAQAAGLSSDITSALGTVATDLEAIPTAVGTAVQQNVPIQPAGLTSDDVTGIVGAALAGWAGPVAQATTPSGTPNSAVTKAATAAKKTTVASRTQAAAQAREAAKPNISTQTSGSRAGLNAKTVVEGGKVYRFYESAPGRADYGKTKNSKIYVRPASGAAGKP